ncbi:MAG TPA: NADH-quinone oxidoreductase subunit NuoE [Thermodesulfovibrionales bacterium]|nr:NADH-quinone oxidoreductase subunit NuoE [Thermodesulfovibrionales bacterium]
MLTEEEKNAIIAELRHYEHRQAACVEALRIVQNSRGWISDEIGEIAGLLDMTPEELDGVATFYSLIFRSPVGRHVILICDSVSCWVVGYEGILDHLTSRLGIGLGETTADGLFTLLPVACLGVCERAPAMMVGDRLYTDLTPDKIDGILETYRQEKA